MRSIIEKESNKGNGRIFNIDVDSAITQLRSSLHHFEIRTKKFVKFFRGKSFEFDGFREFSPDDDVSIIDWKVSVRSNKLLVRRYLEEAPLKIIFAIDTSDNMVFGSTEKLKCEYAAELALGLSHLILRYNNRVGFILFNDKEIYIPARTGTHHFLQLTDALKDPKNYGGDSRFDRISEFISKQFDSSLTALIIISDFARISRKVKKQFDFISERYETLAFFIRDPIDKSLPDADGEFVIEDPRTKEQILLDPNLARAQYKKFMKEEENKIKDILKKAGIDYVELMTDKSFVPDVTEFIKNRVRRV